MKAKPSKCKHLAMKLFGPRPGKYKPHTDASYSAFDAKLSINDQAIEFIGDHLFKFLGRKISSDLSESEQIRGVTASFKEYLDAVDNQPINGFMKLWLYQNYVLAFLAWPFTVYDFNLSVAKRLEVTANKYLKRWAGLPRPANTSILYRSRNMKGLRLTSVSLHYKKMQVLKAHTAKYSKDSNLRAVYDMRRCTDIKKVRKWTATTELEKVEGMVNFDKKFPGQSSRLGLGFGKKRDLKDPSAQHRRDLTNKLRVLDEEQRLVKVYNFAMQGKWTSWDDVMELDLSWKNLIYALPPKLTSFALNAIGLTLPTPDNLRIWGKQSDGRCTLCASPTCTLFHILCNCPYSLQNKRFTWRHDSVLRTLAPFLQDQINKQNESKERMNQSGFITFVREGSNPPRSSTKPQRNIDCILTGSSDWKLLVDYDDAQIVFPAIICATDNRPDVVIWSKESKRVIMIELTVPAEENIANAHHRKTVKYEALIASCLSQGWKTTFIAIEVGCKGFVGFSTVKCCKMLGMSKHSISRLVKLLSKVALRCSYLIYLSRKNREWKPIDLYIHLDKTHAVPLNADSAMFANVI